MLIVPSFETRRWVRPPPIFGPDVRARATADLSLPLAPHPSVLGVKSQKRIRELAAGRRCATQALRDAGAHDVVVGIGPKREPYWPAGFVGSITHSRSFACAAVARSTNTRALGIDSEPIFDDVAMREAVPIALVASERPLIEGTREREFATLIFSAKESLFKCLYPLVGVLFEFTDAQVERIVCAQTSSGTFGLQLRRDLALGFGQGLRLEGRYAIEHDHVHTALELRP